MANLVDCGLLLEITWWRYTQQQHNSYHSLLDSSQAHSIQATVLRFQPHDAVIGLDDDQQRPTPIREARFWCSERLYRRFHVKHSSFFYVLRQINKLLNKLPLILQVHN